MSVVATAVRDLGGTMKFESQPGKGAAFTLKLPLAISIAEAVIVSVADETFAVQQSAVDELLLVPSSDLRSIRSTEVIPYRSGLLPLVRLGKSFGTGGTAGPSVSVLVVGSERGAVGLVVDRVRGQREVVIRPLLDPLLQVSGFSGATELGDGRPILVLDPSDITRGVVRPNEVAAAAT
jgi:two-component system chemotaxis sensor kinase CheA